MREGQGRNWRQGILTLLCVGGLVACGGGGGSSSSPAPSTPPAVGLSASPSDLRGEGGVGVDAVSGAEVVVRNEGGASASVTVDADVDWITVSPASLSIPAGGSASVEVTAACETQGDHFGRVSFAGDGVEAHVGVSIDCRGQVVTIDVLTRPGFTVAGPRDPAEAVLEFRLLSEGWADAPKLRYRITEPTGLMGIDDDSERVELGELVSVDLSWWHCAEGQVEDLLLTVEVTDEIAWANPREIGWRFECTVGDFAVRAVEVYQGPLVRVWDAQRGEYDDDYGGRENIPMLPGRGALLLVALEHDLGDQAPLVAATVGGQGLEPVELSGAVTLAHRDGSGDPWLSEIGFPVPGGAVEPGVRVELEIDPFNVLSEMNESNNAVSFDLPDANGMEASSEVRVQVVGVTLREADGPGITAPAAPSESAVRAVLLDHWPVADGALSVDVIEERRERVFGREGTVFENIADDLAFWRGRDDGDAEAVWVGMVPTGEVESGDCGQTFSSGARRNVIVVAGTLDADGCAVRELLRGFGTLFRAGEPRYEGFLGPNRGWLRSQGVLAQGTAPDLNRGLVGIGEWRDLMGDGEPAFVTDAAYDRVRERMRSVLAGGRDGARYLELSLSADLAGRSWRLDRHGRSNAAAEASTGPWSVSVYAEDGSLLDRQRAGLSAGGMGRLAWQGSVAWPSGGGRVLVEVAQADGLVRFQEWVEVD